MNGAKRKCPDQGWREPDTLNRHETGVCGLEMCARVRQNGSSSGATPSDTTKPPLAGFRFRERTEIELFEAGLQAGSNNSSGRPCKAGPEIRRGAKPR